MTVSVIVPAYNAERWLCEALESILRQTRAPAEIIVVDDGSTDATERVGSDFARRFATVRLIRQHANQGQAAAINRGAACATGAYLAFLDADDVWTPNKLEWQLAAFAADPALEAAFGLAREWVDGAKVQAPERAGRVLPAYLPSALLITREAFERVGGFDPQYTLGSVVDWYARALEANLRRTVVSQVVYERRIHGENLGTVRADRREDYFSVLRAARQRARRDGSVDRGGSG